MNFSTRCSLLRKDNGGIPATVQTQILNLKARGQLRDETNIHILQGMRNLLQTDHF